MSPDPLVPTNLIRRCGFASLSPHFRPRLTCPVTSRCRSVAPSPPPLHSCRNMSVCRLTKGRRRVGSVREVHERVRQTVGGRAASGRRASAGGAPRQRRVSPACARPSCGARVPRDRRSAATLFCLSVCVLLGAVLRCSECRFSPEGGLFVIFCLLAIQLRCMRRTTVALHDSCSELVPAGRCRSL